MQAVVDLAGNVGAAGVLEHRPAGGVGVGEDRVLGTNEV